MKSEDYQKLWFYSSQIHVQKISFDFTYFYYCTKAINNALFDIFNRLYCNID